MKADFYLMGASFHYQTGMPPEELAARIEDLAENCEYIRKYKNSNSRFYHPSVYEVEIYPEISIVDFLYSNIPSMKKLFGAEVFSALQNILDRAIETNISTDDIIDLLDMHDENNAYGLLCLHPISIMQEKSINNRYLVYNKQNWIAFRRYFLGVYPRDTQFFYEEAEKYFPDLYIHERNIVEMRPIYNNFVNKIIQHLGHLNDDFIQYKTIPYQRIETLKSFSIGCNLDEEASNQGNKDDKPKMTFSFTQDKGKDNDKEIEEAICCEPHLKLCYSDNHPGDSQYYFNRIYFHEGKVNVHKGKILIGHIGKHL